jgi:hypothetical protein
MKIALPALCFGSRYQSMTRHPVVDLGNNEVLATLGLVLGTRIGRDCKFLGLPAKAKRKLQRIPIRDRIKMSVKAADFFERATLDCGGQAQSPADYTDLVSRTSGLPVSLVQANTGRIGAALRKTGAVIKGLSGGLPLDIFDTGVGKHAGTTVRLMPRFDALGCNMPNNSPGVHVTWVAAPAFGFPVLVRPGSAEPFTPYRLIQAMIAAGYPKEAFGFYPCDHEGAARIPELTKGAIIFGADTTVNQFAGNPLFELHGSGFSKLFVGDDLVDNWEELIPELALNVAANSGRSCFAVSLIVVPRHAKKIARALAKELARIFPLDRTDPKARLSAMAMPGNAVETNKEIDAALKGGGAIDMSAPFRAGDRLVVHEGRTYMLPTVIYCKSRQHPLANEEFLFPFTAVVEQSEAQFFAEMGSTLSLAVYTHHERLKLRARQSSARLVSVNKGTSLLDRTQPHEGNMFHLLFDRQSYVE